MIEVPESVYAATVGRVVVTLRERAGWSQRELARRLDVGQSTVSRIELGEVMLDMHAARRFALAIGMAPEDFTRLVEAALILKV